LSSDSRVCCGVPAADAFSAHSNVTGRFRWKENAILLLNTVTDKVEKIVLKMFEVSISVVVDPVNQRLKWSCEAGASPGEARLEQNPILIPHPL